MKFSVESNYTVLNATLAKPCILYLKLGIEALDCTNCVEKSFFYNYHVIKLTQKSCRTFYIEYILE